MKTENLGAVVTHNKALKLLLMDREVAGFDIEVAPSRKAKHVLTLRVPRHTVGIGLLRSTGNDGHNRCRHSLQRAVSPQLGLPCCHAHPFAVYLWEA